MSDTQSRLSKEDLWCLTMAKEDLAEAELLNAHNVNVFRKVLKRLINMVERLDPEHRANPPMTRDQVMAMDEIDAVWALYPDKDDCKNIIGLDGAISFKARILEGSLKKEIILFSKRPTAADIESARAANPFGSVSGDARHEE